MHRWLMVVLGTVLLSAPNVFAQTALGLPVDGVQTVWLRNQVGKNQIQFVSAAPMEEIHGTASGISGKLMLDPGNLEAMTGRIEATVASMETGIKKRDEHLHSKDWLDAKAFPVIAFEVHGVKDVSVKVASGKAMIKGVALGTFSLHGVQKELEIPFEATYLVASDQTRKRAHGDFFFIQGTFQIALKDFDIKDARGMVGSRVGTEIDLKANFFGSTAMVEKED